MLLLEENIIRKEYDEVSNDIYAALFTSTQLIDEYSELLKQALLKKVFTTKEQKAHIIQFLAKLKTQRELVELSQNPTLLQQTHQAAESFARKTVVNL